MYSLLLICRLCLLLLVVKTLAQDHRLRTPGSNEPKTRRQPKWSHFFLMHEPRSEEKDKAQGFFYQVGSGPPVINRLRSLPSGLQSQTERSDMPQYNPLLHSPYPNRQQTNQQFGSRMPHHSFGGRMANPPNPALFNEPQVEDPAGGTIRSQIPPNNEQNFQSGPQDVSKQENFPENPNHSLQFEPDTLGDADSKSGTESLGTQGQVSSHATLLLQGNRQHLAVPDGSSKDFPVFVKRRPSFVVGGQSVFGKRKPVPSHLTPIIPPENIKPDGKSSMSDNSNHEREKLRLSIAQHIPTRTGNILSVLDKNYSESESSRLEPSGPDDSPKIVLDGNRDPQFPGTQIPKAEITPENDYLREKEITKDVPNKDGYGEVVISVYSQPENKDSIDRVMNENHKLAEIGKQSETSGWLLQPQLNPQNQEGSPKIFSIDTGNKREREPIAHDFKKPPYQTHHRKETDLPHLPPQKYNYLPVSQSHAQTNGAYNPPSLVNFNTNIHLHGGSPASPNVDFQQEIPKQPSHSLSIHPYVLKRPESEVLQPTLQKDGQTLDTYSGRVPSSQIYILRPSNEPEVPLLTARHQNGPYRQDNRQSFGGEGNFGTSQTPSHLTAILPASLGHSKEIVGQRPPLNTFTSNANQRGPNVEYSDLLLRNQPQDGVVPSVNHPTNTATHSIRLLLPQQQLSQLSPTDVPSGVHHVPGSPNRFQTHQVNLLPNSHGYVQTQVQLPPLNFRFQLTPVKDDTNGSFGDISDAQKIGHQNFQPIPYQYQLPLHPVPIGGTHQIFFPNLQLANVPLTTPIMNPDEVHGSTIKSSEDRSDSQEKSEPVTEPSILKDPADEAKTWKDQADREETIRKTTEDNISVSTVTDNGTDVDKNSKLLENVSLPSNIPVEEYTEKNTKEDAVIKSVTPHEETNEKSTTDSKNAHIQLSSTVINSDEKETKDVITTGSTSLELTTKSQLSSPKPSIDLLSVLTFTEAPKIEDSATKSIDDVETGGNKLVEEKHITTSGDLESSSFSAGDSGDRGSSELSTSTSEAPATVTSGESTTLKQTTGDLADINSSESPTTVSEAPSTVSTTESIMFEEPNGDLSDKRDSELSSTASDAPATVSTSEQSKGDLSDENGSELSTTTSKSPTTLSTTTETATLEKSTENLAAKDSSDLSTSNVPTTVSNRESTTLEEAAGDFTDKSISELTTTISEAPVTVSNGISTVTEHDQTFNTEKELNNEVVSGTSDPPQVITDEDSTASDLKLDSVTSTVSEHTFSSQTPGDSFTITNIPSSTDTTTVTISSIRNMSSVSTGAEIVTELPETTSASTISILPSSAQTISMIPDKGTTSDSVVETTVSSTPSATQLPEEIMSTTTTASTSAETGKDGLSSDQLLETERNPSTHISVLKELETVTTSASGSEMIQTNDEVLLAKTSTESSVTVAIKEIVTVVDISSTTATEGASDSNANEIENFVTSPASDSSSTSFEKIPVTTGSSDDKFIAFDKLSVFTFTEGPISKRKIEKPNGEDKRLTPEEKSKDNGTQTRSEESGQKVESTEGDSSVVNVPGSKDPEVSLNEVFIVPTRTSAVEDAADDESNKLFGDEMIKNESETNIEPTLKTTKQPEDRAIFTFVGKNISQTTEEKTEFSFVAVTSSSTSVSTEDSKVVTFTEKNTAATLDHEILITTPNPEIETKENQGRSVGNTDSKNQTEDDARELPGVLNGRERNENEVSLVESGISSNLYTTESGSDEEVRSVSEIASLDDRETKDKSGQEETTTIESQNTFTNETPKISDSEISVISDSETTTESKINDPTTLDTTTSSSGNDKVTGSPESSSKDTPMIIDNDALELLLNDLVTPRNISFLAPVTSTSISIAIGAVPTESPERILNEDKTELSENPPTGQDADIFGTANGSLTVVKNEVQGDNTNLPESDNGSSFFSKVFEKSLLPTDNEKQNLPKDSVSEAKASEDESKGISTVSTEKEQSETSQESIQTSSSSATETPSSVSETQVTTASVSPETEVLVSDLSSVKLTGLDNFEGKDLPDFTEISKQHAR